jgi:hypothetical protein
MAFSTLLPIQLPGDWASPNAEVISDDSGSPVPLGEPGWTVAWQAIQTCYVNTKIFAAVADISAAGVLTSFIGESYRWYAKTCHYDGTSGQRADLWLWVIRALAEGGGENWSVTIRNLTFGSTTGARVVNGGAAAPLGTWWYAGTLTVAETAQQSLWEIETTALAGAGAKACYAVLFIPPRNRATAISLTGGYTNGVNPIDAAYHANQNDFASTAVIEDAHTMAVRCWERATGQILTATFECQNYMVYGADARQMYTATSDQFVWCWTIKPSGCKSIRSYIFAGAAGTVTVMVQASPVVVQNIAVGAGVWTVGSVDVSTVSAEWPVWVKVFSTVDILSISLWFNDADYSLIGSL